MLVEHHPHDEGERIAAEQFVRRRVLGDAQLSHAGSVPHRLGDLPDQARRRRDRRYAEQYTSNVPRVHSLLDSERTHDVLRSPTVWSLEAASEHVLPTDRTSVDRSMHVRRIPPPPSTTSICAPCGTHTRARLPLTTTVGMTQVSCG